MDPLGADPIVVTGSANFSKASTTDNDENMLLIRGNKRVADIYFTEFNRLFNHYYFQGGSGERSAASRWRDTVACFSMRPVRSGRRNTPTGKLRAKRLKVYTR